MSLQYIFNNKIESLTTVAYNNINPLLDVTQILFFTEFNLTGNWISKEFRYSFDNIIWTSWATLTQQALINIVFTNQPTFYLELLYTRAAYDSASLEDFYLFYEGVETIPDPIPPDDIQFDAATLEGEPGSYYLDRENHTGPFTDLIVRNTEDAIGIGVYDETRRADSSSGTTLVFKQIVGEEGVNIIESSTGLLSIAIDASSIVDNYFNTEPVSTSVGGILSGDLFFDPAKNFSETMQAMFHPTLYPTFTNPSNSFTDNKSSLQEIGDIIDVTFTSSFSRGTITPPYGTNGFRSGPGNTVHLLGDLIAGDVGLYPNSPYVATASNYNVLIGTQSWSSAWSFDTGEQPLDSIGDDYMLPYYSGTTIYKSVSFEGVYPLSGTTSDITNPNTLLSLISMKTGNYIVFSMKAETGGFKQSFDIPDDWIGSPTNRPLSTIQTYSTVSGNWETTGLTDWTPSPTTHIIQTNTINYTRYTFNSDDRGEIQIRLVF